MSLDAKHVLVTFRRRVSGQIHQVRFECGIDNPRMILREAWNTNSEVISTEDV